MQDNPDTKTCLNCGVRPATERDGELCEPCACTVDWGRELPAGQELELSVRNAGGGWNRQGPLVSR
jgi:hypothetical protein